MLVVGITGSGEGTGILVPPPPGYIGYHRERQITPLT